MKKKIEFQLPAKEIKYLHNMISSELKKFEIVAEQSKDPTIKEEKRILTNIYSQIRSY